MSGDRWLMLFFVGGVAAGALAVVAFRAGDRAELRAAEAKLLTANDALVAETASRKKLEREAAALEAQIEKIRGAAPGAKIVEVVKWKSGPIAVPLPSPAAEAPAGPGCLESPAGQPGPSLEVEVRGTEARLETRAGNRVAVGEVELWRTKPPPPALLGKAAWEADASSLFVAPEEAPRARWEAGPLIGLSGDGIVYGAAVAAPGLRWRRLSVRPFAAAMAGAQNGTVAAGVLVSW